MVEEKQVKATEKAVKDTEEMQSFRQTFLKKCKAAKKVKVLLPVIYGQYFGRVYTFTLNTIPVTLEFDGKEHEYPDFIAEHIQEKMQKVLAENFPEVKNEKI